MPTSPGATGLPRCARFASPPHGAARVVGERATLDLDNSHPVVEIDEHQSARRVAKTKPCGVAG
jgi:hypothetical protein